MAHNPRANFWCGPSHQSAFRRTGVRCFDKEARAVTTIAYYFSCVNKLIKNFVVFSGNEGLLTILGRE